MSRVLVVGAGLAGTLLAGLLARSGAAVVLAERRPDQDEIGAGITVHGNGNRALQRAGLPDGVTGIGRPIRRLAVHTLGPAPDVGGVAQVDIAGLWPADAPACAVHRQELHRLLLDRLGEVDVRLGSPVSAVVQDGPVVTATVADRRMDFDLVVGADGIGSTVRRAIAPDVVPRDLGQTYLRTVVALPGPPDLDWAVWHRPGANAGLLRLRDGRFHVFVQLVGRRRASAEGGMAAVLAGSFPDVPELAMAAAHVGTAHVTDVAAVSCAPAKGAIALVGDAAHGTSPVLSQGASLAFEDVLVLAEELVGARSPAEAVARYAVRRRAAIAWLHRMTRLHSAAARRNWTSSATTVDEVYRQTYAGFAAAA